jgi:hypothetical protein
MLKQVIAGEAFTFRNSAELNEKAGRKLGEKERLLETNESHSKRLKKEIKAIRKFLGIRQTRGQRVLRSPAEPLL